MFYWDKIKKLKRNWLKIKASSMSNKIYFLILGLCSTLPTVHFMHLGPKIFTVDLPWGSGVIFSIKLVFVGMMVLENLLTLA